MPRKSTAAELQAEEAAISSPLRRSNRIVTGNGATPAGIVTRRTSQTLEPQANTPVRATRGRRASAQDSEENIETKPVARTRRASMLAEDESQKERPSTPIRRGRKPSLTTESTEKEEPEKPKSVRGRRTSTASTAEESDEKKPSKTASVKGRRSSANVEPETEVKATTKTPARTISRRRSSTAENAVVEEVSVPAKRTTRGRKASDVDEIGTTTEDVKKPAMRGRKKSVDQEDDNKNEKPSSTKDRKTSTQDSSVNIAPKTVGTPRRRPSINQETNIEESSKDEKKDSSEMEEPKAIDDGIDAEEEMSPIILKEISIKVTPLKKRKILDKMEVELDLSIINESADDIENGKHDDSSKEITEKHEREKDSKQIKLGPDKSTQSLTENLVDKQLSISPQVILLKENLTDMSSIDRSLNSADEANRETSELSNKVLDSSALESQNTPSTKKRSGSANDDNPSPRKSPRLTEKISRNNTPKEEGGTKVPTPRKPRNLMKENDKECSVNEKSQPSFVSSGSDGSFKFHLSNVSMANSAQQDSNKENTEEDLLNTSKESTGSNKENIEEVDSLNSTKPALDLSAKIPLQTPIVVSRLSNAFKTNQKEYSFMEPMEVDEDSVIFSELSVAEKSTNLNNYSAEVSTDGHVEKNIDLDESSIVFQYKTSKILPEKSADGTTQGSPNHQKVKSLPILESAKNMLNQNLTDTEGSDTNLIIEETQDTVNFSIKRKTEIIEIPTSTSTQIRTRSPAGNNASLIINQPLQQVKVLLLGKSSSPIIAKQKLKSPVLRAADSTDSENDVPSRSKNSCRRSSSRSPSFIPESNENLKALVLPRRSKSKSKSPSPGRSSARSPSFLCLDSDHKVGSRKSKSPVDRDREVLEIKGSRRRSQSKSPLPDSQKTPIVQDGKKLRLRRSGRSKSKSPIPDLQATPVIQKNQDLSPKEPKSKSSVVDLQETPVSQDGDKLRSRRSIVSSSIPSPLPVSEETPIAQYAEELSSKRMIKSKGMQESEIFRSRSKSLLPQAQRSSVGRDNEILEIRSARSKSKSPLPESTVLDQSFEKPKGSEEILVVNENKSIEPTEILEKRANAKDDDTSLKDVSGSVTTNLYKSIESQLEVTDLNCTESVQTNLQDRTEYHTAITTANNESNFTSLINETEQSHIKDSESTHYDFDLDSDEDDLLQSKNSSSVVGIKTSVLDKQTLALQKELANQSQVVTEMKKPVRKSKSPEDKLEKNAILIDDEKLAEIITEGNSNEPSKDVEEGKNDNINALSRNQESLSALSKSDTKKTLENESSNTKEKDVLTEEIQISDWEKQSEDLIGISTVGMKDAVEDKSNTGDKSESTGTKKSESINTSIVTDTGDKKTIDRNVEADSQKMSHKEKDMHQVHSKETLQPNISVEEAESNGDPEDLSTNLDEIAKINQTKEEKPEKDNEKIKPNKTKEDVTVNEDINKSTSQGNKKKSPMMSTEVLDDEDDNKKSKSTKELQVNEENKIHKKSPDHSYCKEVDINSPEKVIKEYSKKENDDQRENSKINESVETVSTCKMAPQKVDTSQSHGNSINKKPKLQEVAPSTRPKPSLDDLASAKLKDYLDSRAECLTGSSSEEVEEESEAEYSEFIDGMAEEGEEDTPSEDSNQIIDEGESIGYSSNEQISEDDYDSNDSFICDEEQPELLSGDEYDLGNQKKTKKSRIIDPSTLGEEDIIKIPEKKNLKKEPKKRSRIIVVSDSSEDEQEVTDSVLKVEEKNDKEHIENVIKDQSVGESIILIEDSTNLENSIDKITKESKMIETSIIIEDSKDENTGEAIITIEDSEIVNSSKEIPMDRSTVNDINKAIITDESHNESVQVSQDNLNTSLQTRNRKSSLCIQENITVDGIKDPLITKRINNLVESFCATVKKGEVSLNLSLEYESTTQDKDKKQAVHVLSDIKISPLDSQEEDSEQQESALSISLSETGDLRTVLHERNLKRRLSKSMGDMNEEVNEAKRRKTHEVGKGKKKAATSKTKKRNKVKRDPVEELKTAVSSFSIMNQLITDVKNRPKRIIKPTTTDVESNWSTTKVSNLKPSTSPATKQEKIKIQPKLHPKDFKNQMLSDNKRVKRIDTMTLLKKKGAF